jgi:hypothetical protein
MEASSRTRLTSSSRELLDVVQVLVEVEGDAGVGDEGGGGIGDVVVVVVIIGVEVVVVVVVVVVPDVPSKFKHVVVDDGLSEVVDRLYQRKHKSI